VRHLPPSDSPDPFRWIEFGGIWWQENTYYPILICVEKLSQILRFVPSCIVQNKVYFPLSRLKKITDKLAKGLGTESGRLLGNQTPGFQVERSKEACFVADRRREYAGLLSLGCPHPDQTAVPLEMDFVLAPKLDCRVFHPLVVVFLKVSCRTGLASLACRRGLWRLNPSLWNSL